MNQIEKPGGNLRLDSSIHKIGRKPKVKDLGLAGIGIISLCGLACSLPVLLGGLAIGGTAVWSFLSLSWLVAGGVVVLIMIAAWFLVRIRNTRAKMSRLMVGRTNAGVTKSDGSVLVAGSVSSADSSCGCKP